MAICMHSTNSAIHKYLPLDVFFTLLFYNPEIEIDLNGFVNTLTVSIFKEKLLLTIFGIFQEQMYVTH